MNRIDKTAEPSMEDILASIRRIISDEDRPDEASTGSRSSATSGVDSQRLATLQHFNSPADSLPEDEVFDLTDDFAITDTASAASSAETHKASTGDNFGSPSSRIDRYETPREPQGFTAPASRFSADETAGRDSSKSDVKRPASTQATPAAQPTRPSWSRRELPNQPAPARPSEPAAKRETVAAKTAASAPWAQPNGWDADVKIPVPDSGPVSLVGGDASRSNRVPGAFETAASSLAQNAVHALDDGELTQASGIDFDEIEDDDKARISESIAHVLSAATEGQQSNVASAPETQASVLDRVLSRDFRRSQDQTPDANQSIAEPWMPSMHEDAVEAPPQRYNEADRHRPAAKTAAPTAPNQSREIASATQAQFLGVSSPPVSENGGRSLEDSVREMLRPMLVQWLNENMPRILEDAIRKEISVRGISGLLPETKS